MGKCALVGKFALMGKFTLVGKFALVAWRGGGAGGSYRPTLAERPSRRFYVETLTIHQLISRKFTTQSDL